MKRRPPQSVLPPSTDGGWRRLDTGPIRPHPHAGQAGGSFGVQKVLATVTGLRFLEALRISFDWAAALVAHPVRFAVGEPNDTIMRRVAAPLLACMFALANALANAQADATRTTPDNGESAHSLTASEPNGAAAQTPTVDDVCRALEQSAAENALPAASMRGLSVPRERRGSPNSCRARPIGTVLPIRSIPSRPCGIRLLTCANC